MTYTIVESLSSLNNDPRPDEEKYRYDTPKKKRVRAEVSFSFDCVADKK